MTLKDKFKKFASWAFNNNGNEVDYDRIDLVHGTSLHATGWHWLKEQWEMAAVPAVAITSYFTSAQDPSLYTPSIVCALLFATLGKGYRWSIINQHQYDRLCILKNPKKDAGPLTKDHIISAEKFRDSSLKNFAAGLAVTTSINTLFLMPPFKQGMPKYTYFGVCAAFIPITLDFLKAYLRFKKVTDDKWIIEEPPKPKKKQEKEKPVLIPALIPA